MAENAPLIIKGPEFKFAVDILTAVFLTGYVISTSCLAFSYSNLSFKKIQTRGPYGLVRHPATLCKLGYFTITIFKHRAALAPAYILAFSVWILVYVLRAICEERYLRRFQVYRDYMEQVRYRFIPKIL